MKNLIYILLLILIPGRTFAQDPNGNYNPYVSNGTINPSPLWPLEANGKGAVSFNFGNTGSDPLHVYTNQFITLTISLSYGVPDNANPLLAVGGTFASLFSWTYSSGTYTGIQTGSIPANSSGTISIDYKVTQNSSSPGLNGFNVNIAPAPYQVGSNTQNDDAVSSYTYTEIKDYGDAPASYGIAEHILDFQNYLGSSWDGEAGNQPSSLADADDNTGVDDEDGVNFTHPLRQGETTTLSVFVTGMGRLNAWIDWNGDGDFADAGERIADNIPRFDGWENLNINVPSGAIISAPTFARFRFSPGTLSSGTGSANGGEAEDYRISISSSLLAPPAPTGLKLDSQSETSVSLSWNASAGTGITAYRIYRNSTLIGTSTEPSYTDNSVSAGNSYTYSVSAINDTGLESDLSAPVVVEITDQTPPSVPAGLRITSITETSVSLAWNASTDNVGVTGYHVFKNGNLLTTTTSLVLTDNAVMVGNSYTYAVSAFDGAGNESNLSSGVNASILDVSAPSVPSNLHTTAIGSGSVSLSWNPSTDNVGVTGYRIFRNENSIGTSNQTSYTDNTVEQGQIYNYAVSAFDSEGNESEPSVTIEVTIEDTEAPGIPQNLQISSLNPGSVTLVWDASTDNVGISEYLIYRDGIYLASSGETTYTDESIQPDMIYSYTVSAMDEAGNESAQSSPVSTTDNDQVPPTTPTGLTAVSASAEGLTIKWNESTDNIAVSGYRVFRNGSLLTTVNGTSNTDHGVEGGKTYSYSVLAFDEAGNESDHSEPLVVSLTSTEYIIVGSLNVYPNPSKGIFNIGLTDDTGKFNLEIITALGTAVVINSIELEENSLELNLEFLERGIYYIRLYNETKIYDGRLMIVK